MVKRCVYAALFILISSPVFAQVVDPILSDEPEQNIYEDRKKQEIQKAIEDTKAEKAAYGGDQLLYVGAMFPSEFTLGASIGLGYGSYNLRNELASANRLQTVTDYGPFDNKALILGLQAAYVNVLDKYSLELNYRRHTGSMDGIKGFAPGGNNALDVIRQRLTAEAFWTNIFGGFFLKGGFAYWGRSGTATTPKRAYSLYRALGITVGLGYTFDLTQARSWTLRPMLSYDRPIKYSEQNTQTGTGSSHFGGQFDLRLRWRAWPKVMFELAPYARYERTSFEAGSTARSTKQPVEQDISVGVPISVVFSF